ncbi:hypothetical protein BHO_0111700 [Borrelia hermsii YBT]|nr:hypothetical protein BHO_0111700 [Borrelia hermsii YBT]
MNIPLFVLIKKYKQVLLDLKLCFLIRLCGYEDIDNY